MNTILEAADRRPRPRPFDTQRVLSRTFVWSIALNLPMLKQSRLRDVSRGRGELWIDQKTVKVKILNSFAARQSHPSSFSTPGSRRDRKNESAA